MLNQDCKIFVSANRKFPKLDTFLRLRLSKSSRLISHYLSLLLVLFFFNILQTKVFHDKFRKHKQFPLLQLQLFLYSNF